MNPEERRKHSEEFVRRLIRRRPQDRERYERALNARDEIREIAVEGVTEGAAAVAPLSRSRLLETIVDEERPVFFVSEGWLDTGDVSLRGPEAHDLMAKLQAAEDLLRPMLPLVGRIDVTNFPHEFVGTGWFVAEDIVVTNRHVASLIARWDGRQFVFNRSIGGRMIGASLSTAHEKDDAAAEPERVFAVREVLYIERETGLHDIAFVRVARRANANAPVFVPVATSDVGADTPVCVVGYPARASKRVIPDQALMEDLYRGRYDVKRVAPGFTLQGIEGTGRHDCTTLGGNSGSLVLDLKTGSAVGLHFAGLYQETNYAVRASVLNEYVTRRRWNEPYVIESRPAAPPVPGVVPAAGVGVSGAGTLTFTIPLTVSVVVGAPVLAAPAAEPLLLDGARVEQAARAFWAARPPGILAVRVGYHDDGESIGDVPFIAAAVLPSRIHEVAARGPREHDGVPIRYLPAEVSEQVDARAVTESVDSISYDDDARTGTSFSLDRVYETMDVSLHVGPEYSWAMLQSFLEEESGDLVSAMYEFHAPTIKDALEAHLERGASLTLVLDNASFHEVKNEDEEFDRASVFAEWAERYGARFKRIVAPEGKAGLISDAYHIKVTVREDDTFWLSSGNWKMGSSQPVITQEQRDNAATEDLPGNREWHVIVKSRTLAERFRNHILQDYERSLALGGRELPRSQLEAGEETLVEVPVEEAVVLERRPPGRVLEPMVIRGKRMKVRPLLTPDEDGSLFAEAVLELIESAQDTLLFQIPYIAMPSIPNVYRGYIDDLLAALTRKLESLRDARVLLRAGGSKYSSPTHAAWYFKSKGVDIGTCLRSVADHHTKGMIVDGRRVLVGSHNWSKPGVTLNRDASLLFDNPSVAAYYAKAFEIDWARSNPIKPKKFVKPEGVSLEAAGLFVPAAYERVALSGFTDDM